MEFNSFWNFSLAVFAAVSRVETDCVVFPGHFPMRPDYLAQMVLSKLSTSWSVSLMVWCMRLEPINSAPPVTSITVG